MVVAGIRPRVACGLTADRRVLNRALDAVEPTDGPTRIADAVELARRLLAGHPNGQIEVLTDGCDDAHGRYRAAGATSSFVWSAAAQVTSASSTSRRVAACAI